jgi:hypothetical protein
MISYTLLNADYVIIRDGNTSVTFNKDAADLWETYEKWVEDGNTPTPAQDDPFLAEQSTPNLS